MGPYSVHALESFGDKPRRPWVKDNLRSFARSNGDVVRSAAARTPEMVVRPRKPSDWPMNSFEAQRAHLQCGKEVDGGRPGCVIACRKGTTKPRMTFGERVSADPCDCPVWKRLQKHSLSTGAEAGAHALLEMQLRGDFPSRASRPCMCGPASGPRRSKESHGPVRDWRLLSETLSVAAIKDGGWHALDRGRLCRDIEPRRAL